jgi:hypothetical protein
MYLVKMGRVTPTTTSSTLAALGLAIPAQVDRVLLLPAATGVNMNLGAAASADTPVVPQNGFDFPITASGAKLLQFYGTGATMDVYFFQQHGVYPDGGN